MRPSACPRVLRAVADPSSRLVVTSVTRAELRLGIALLPDGEQRELLGAALDELGSGDVIPFDGEAADRYGPMEDASQRAGLSVPVADLTIAATTSAHNGTLLTRNTSDFADAGIDLVDPWRQ